MEMGLGLSIIAFLLSLGVCIVLMPPFIKLMTKYRILDKAGGRKIHTGYTAHMGGIVIFIAFIVGMLAMIFSYHQQVDSSRLIFMGIVLIIMLFVGIRDDMHNISPWSKLFFEIIVGILMSYMGVRLESLNGFLGIYDIPMWFSYGITICFFIVVVNAYNLIDGIDGQAGLQAVNVFVWCLLFYLFVIKTKSIGSNIVSPIFMYIAALSILGALAGFLRFNWQKASIFMGDAGSLFIGTLITIFIITSSKYACIAQNIDLANNTSQYTIAGHEMKAVLAPFLFIFYLPMADTLRVFIQRARKGKSPFSADKTHIHHLFIRLGYSHQRCALTTFAISMCISIVGILLAFFFNDNVCIPVIILSWFVYVYALRAIVISKLKQQGGGV